MVFKIGCIRSAMGQGTLEERMQLNNPSIPLAAQLRRRSCVAPPLADPHLHKLLERVSRVARLDCDHGGPPNRAKAPPGPSLQLRGCAAAALSTGDEK